MNRISIINALIAKNKYTSYAEIGVRDGSCFNAINCETKVGVDPDPTSAATHYMTSDDYFESIPWNAMFDIIFIDGLHVSTQVNKDIKNALKHLNENGTIVMHDCLPTCKEMQEIPDPSNGTAEWTGDVWKAFLNYRENNPELSMCVVDTDYGCGILKKQGQEVITVNVDLSFENFQKYKNYWMNIISLDQFQKRYLV